MTRFLRPKVDPVGLALILLVVANLTAGCVFVPAVTWRRVEENRARLNRVQVGQTLAEVRAIMGTEPERRETRQRFDGKVVELWSWASDAARKLDTTVIFVDGRVTELRTTSWEEKD